MKVKRTVNKRDRRILTWVLVGTFVSIIAVTAFTYFSYQRAASDLVVERDRQLIYLSAAHLKEEMEKYTEVLQSVARTAEMSAGDVKTQVASLEKSAIRLSVFDGGVILLNNLGKVVGSVPEREEIRNQDWSDRDYFNQLLISSNDYFSNIIADGPEESDVIVISVPIYGSRGEFIGALAGMFRLDATNTSSFYASIVRLRIGNNGTTFITDDNDRLVYSSSSAGIITEPDGFGFNWTALQGETGAMRTKNATGKDVVVAYAKVPGTNWTLITENDWGMMTSTTRPYANLMLIMMGLGMLLPAALVAVILRRRDREIQTLERAQQEYHLYNQLEDALTPAHIPLLPDWDLSVGTRAYDQPDNDFYDFMFLPDGKLMIALGTIHLAGVNALVSHASIRANLRNAALCEFSPAQALERTNTLIFPDLEENQVIDCLYAVLDPAAGQLAYAAAGMKFMMISNHRESSLLDTPGPPLGKSLSSRYESGNIRFHNGSRLLLLTNGLFESLNGEGRTIDPQIIANQLNREELPLPSITDNILYIYRDFVKDTLKQAEDITSIAIEHAIRTPTLHTTGRAKVIQNFGKSKVQYREGE